MRRLAAALTLAVALAACGGSHDKAQTRSEVIRSIGTDGGFDAQSIYKAEAPGVVTVLSLFAGGESGEGAGFVLDDKGEIATNAHVIATGENGGALKRARKVFVEFADGNRVEAKILGHDPNADVALLRVDPQGLNLRVLPLGDIAEVKVGQPVAAIGSPFGQAQSLSIGVVSALDRSVASLTDFQISGAIQTDAAINPGNSGGPLVGADGRVIGINQQIETQSGGGEGVGFAVPIDVVKHSLEQLRDGGQAHYAYLGVSSVSLYPQLVDHFDLGVDKGAWVQDVNPGSPAAQAGIKGGTGAEPFQVSSYGRGGDVITKVGDTPITSSDDLGAVVSRSKPGQTVTVEVHRGGDTHELHLKLGERPLGRASRSDG
jgi:S1-C subfamily serine protease